MSFTACDSSTWGTGCSQQCTCNLTNTADCDDVTGACTCKSGYDGVNCTNDMDECTTNTASCGSNSDCVNTVGSYRCVCQTGWTGTGGNCDTDINECLLPPPVCGSHGSCSNFPGSYNCTCDKGWSGTHCDDGNCFIDRTICQGNTECVGENGTNTTCQCLPGYDATCSGIAMSRSHLGGFVISIFKFYSGRRLMRSVLRASLFSVLNIDRNCNFNGLLHHHFLLRHSLHFYTPVFRRDVLWYDDVRPSVRLSVRPSVRPSESPSDHFPHFSHTCFDILS